MTSTCPTCRQSAPKLSGLIIYFKPGAVFYDGQMATLTHMQAIVLDRLRAAHGKPISWVDIGSSATHVSHLRQIIEPWNFRIECIKGQGYQLIWPDAMERPEQ